MYLDIHNSQQLWISIIHNCMVGKYVYSIMDTNVQLWQSIMATHDTIMDIHKDHSNMDIPKFNYGYL